MAWYNVFSRFYDASLEPLYREHRRRALDALQVKRGSVVLDLPCGTGQSFAPLAAALGGTGRIVGVDRSAGMLREARRRVESATIADVTLLEKSASEITAEDVGGAPDRLLVCLGMTVFSEHDATAARRRPRSNRAQWTGRSGVATSFRCAMPPGYP